ncbi:hypothetical protein MKZ38_007753 [Zalerion maritima]|uniref:CENP-V/GFA domain-containing protein n=1 Tax=Zalerion maritima TaxID=339359 RepID=A0AAD5WWD6_9PEZI|nr:hypothetical protein MKZ38_007753 [Zalerion maritima]
MVSFNTTSAEKLQVAQLPRFLSDTPVKGSHISIAIPTLLASCILPNLPTGFISRIYGTGKPYHFHILFTCQKPEASNILTLTRRQFHSTPALLNMDVRCQCASVAFKMPSATPLDIYCCHCTECQKQSSSAFGMSAISRADGIFPIAKDLEGKFSPYTRKTDEGNTMDCYFYGMERRTVSVKGGAIKGLECKRLKHIFTLSAVVEIPHDAIETFDGAPTTMTLATEAATKHLFPRHLPFTDKIPPMENSQQQHQHIDAIHRPLGYLKRAGVAASWPLRGIWYCSTHQAFYPLFVSRFVPLSIISFLVYFVLFTFAFLPQFAFLAIFHGWGAWLNAVVLVLGEGLIIVQGLFEGFFVDECRVDVFDAVLIEKGHIDLVAPHRLLFLDAPNPVKMLGKPTTPAAYQPWSLIQMVELIVFLPLNLIPIVGTPAFIIITGTRLGKLAHYRWYKLRGLTRKQKKKEIRDRLWDCVWFGTVAMILELIPIFSFFFLLTSTAGSALWADRMESSMGVPEGQVIATGATNGGINGSGDGSPDAPPPAPYRDEGESGQ